MNADEVKNKISAGEYTLREKHHAKSSIWAIFREIWNENGKLVPNWVSCPFCRNVYGYDRKLGTSNLLKHKCGKGKILPRSVIDLQDRVMDGCLKFVTKDLRPFDIIKGKGFMDLAEAFVDMGVTLKGQSDFVEIFPHLDYFSPRLDFFAQRNREQLANELTERVCPTGGGIVLETWEKGGETYLSASVHYAKDLTVVDRVLSMSRVDSRQLEEEEYLKERTMQKKSAYGISDWLRNFVYVCPHGSFVQVALKDVRKINCASTPINNALNHAFSSDQSELVSLKICRDVVSHVLRADLIGELKFPPVLDSENRWESTLKMCGSVIENLSAIRKCLAGSRWEGLMESLVEGDLVDLVEFLNPFRQALSEMDAEKHPTLYLVYLWHFKILDHLGDRLADYQPINLFKASLRRRYLEEVDIDLVHKVAVFLHPLLKSMKMVSSKRKKLEVHQWVRSRVEEIKESTDGDKEGEAARRQSGGEPSRLSEAMIHFMDTETVTDHREEDELDLYLRMKLSEAVVNGFDLLGWWDRQKHQLPNLCVLANRIFAVPATSQHHSHCFSMPRDVLRERRVHLDPSSLDKVLFLNSHFKYS